MVLKMTKCKLCKKEKEEFVDTKNKRFILCSDCDKVIKETILKFGKRK